MAKQTGILKLTGTIGNITFYKTRNGYLAKQKNSVSRKRIMKDPAYAGTRRTMSEFGHASALGRVFRYAVAGMILPLNRGYFPSRLTALFGKIIRTDKVNAPGKRELLRGELSLMKGLEISESERLDAYVDGMPSLSVDEEASEAVFSFSGLTKADLLKYPKGATHFTLEPGLVLMGEDPGRRAYFAGVRYTDRVYVPVKKGPGGMEDIRLSFQRGPDPQLLCGLLALRFYQQVNGEMHPLAEGACARVVHAERLEGKDPGTAKGKTPGPGGQKTVHLASLLMVLGLLKGYVMACLAAALRPPAGLEEVLAVWGSRTAVLSALPVGLYGRPYVPWIYEKSEVYGHERNGKGTGGLGVFSDRSSLGHFGKSVFSRYARGESQGYGHVVRGGAVPKSSKVQGSNLSSSSPSPP